MSGLPDTPDLGGLPSFFAFGPEPAPGAYIEELTGIGWHGLHFRDRAARTGGIRSVRTDTQT